VPITTTFTTDRALVMRSYRATHGLSYSIRWAVCLGAIVLGLVSRSPLVVAAGAGVLIFGEVSLRRALKPLLDGKHVIAVRITEDEYRTTGPDRERSRPWSTITGVRRSGDFWVLRLSFLAAVALPTAALDDAQTAEFIALVRSKGLLRR
jgi:hypothetical protein